MRMLVASLLCSVLFLLELANMVMNTAVARGPVGHGDK